MDYEKIRGDAANRKAQLEDRQQEIAKELDRLKKEGEQNQREFIGLDELLESLEFMQHPEIPPDLEPIGFTDHIRDILQGSSAPLTPTEIRNLLLAKGVTGSSPRNLLISVHTVLGRLTNNVQKVNQDGKAAYQWKGIRRFARRRRRAPNALHADAPWASLKNPEEKE